MRSGRDNGRAGATSAESATGCCVSSELPPVMHGHGCPIARRRDYYAGIKKPVSIKGKQAFFGSIRQACCPAARLSGTPPFGGGCGPAALCPPVTRGLPVRKHDVFLLPQPLHTMRKPGMSGDEEPQRLHCRGSKTVTDYATLSILSQRTYYTHSHIFFQFNRYLPYSTAGRPL